MNSTPERNLERFRLAPPAPELRARVLAAARQEWDKPAPASEWAPLKRPLLAIAAALVLAAAGSWTNQRLVSPAVQAPAWKPVVFAGGIPSRFATLGSGFVDPKAALAAIQLRHDQMRKLTETIPAPAAAPAPDGQTRQYRQNPPGPASCC